MRSVASIVEGDGEVAAVPVLLRRLCAWLSPDVAVDVLFPIRVRKDRFLNKDDEFRRQLLLAGHKAGEGGLVLVLLDADDDCPASKGVEILDRARKVYPFNHLAVVFANREFEAWFIAAAESLNGVRSFQTQPGDEATQPETPRNAKGWVRERMEGSYGEVVDQPAFTASFDLARAHETSRSFRKLCDEWRRFTDSA